MEKPIYEKMEYLREKIYAIFLTTPKVVNVDLEIEDVVADFDFIVSFKKNEEVKKEIIGLVKKIETEFNCIKVKILNEQIQDLMNDDRNIIDVDFYCTINL